MNWVKKMWYMSGFLHQMARPGCHLTIAMLIGWNWPIPTILNNKISPTGRQVCPKVSNAWTLFCFEKLPLNFLIIHFQNWLSTVVLSRGHIGRNWGHNIYSQNNSWEFLLEDGHRGNVSKQSSQKLVQRELQRGLSVMNGEESISQSWWEVCCCIFSCFLLQQNWRIVGKEKKQKITFKCHIGLNCWHTWL